MKQLNLGCGGYPFEGWTNYDLVHHPLVERWDLRLGIPDADNSVDRIFSEHFFEHIDFYAGKRLLTECYRVLKPGGQMIVVMPDLARYVSAYHNYDRDLIESIGLWEPNGQSFCRMLNQLMRAWGHTFVWDQDLYCDTITQIGFREILCNLGWPIEGWPGNRYLPTDMRIICQK